MAKQKAITEFFVKQLDGEPGLPVDTAKALLKEAAICLENRPWERLTEEHLFFVEAEGGPHACSIMGLRGEHRSFCVYPGMDGLRHFLRLIKQGPTTRRFFEEHRSVSVVWDKSSGLERPDRLMLETLGEPMQGPLLPSFRAGRPKYFPWHITGPEGDLLLACLRAFNGAYPAYTPDWFKDRQYPFIGAMEPFAVRLAGAPDPGPFPLEYTLPPEHEFPANLPVSEAEVQIDVIYLAAPVGGMNDRKSTGRVGLCVDIATAAVQATAVVGPGVSDYQLALQALLKYVAKSGAVPGAVEVRCPGMLAMLREVLEDREVALERCRELSALEFVEEQLTAAVG